MKKLNYYLDTKNGFILAYERSSEFFERFVPETGEWEAVGISFSQFMHDYDFAEISEENVSQKTGGKLADEKLEQYEAMLKRNLGEPV